jgi:hypothetical protein
MQAMLSAAALATVAVLPTPAQASGKKTDHREIEARQAFAAGRYQEALGLYVDLYADKVHPTFLRNIGRCYQNLQQPDKAINAFRDYLRQAKHITATERTEVEGYIAEMEALKKQQEAEQATAAAAPATSAPVAPVAPRPEPTSSRPQLVTQPLQQQAPEPTPVYKKGWFWGTVAVVVVAGVVGGLAAGGVFSSKSTLPCSAAGGCY